MRNCTGTNLTIFGEDEANGFYLIKLGDPETRTKIDMRDVIENRPAQLRIQLSSDLAEGNYQVEVVTQYSGHNNAPLKTSRTYRFEQILTVGAGESGGDEGGDDVLS